MLQNQIVRIIFKNTHAILGIGSSTSRRITHCLYLFLYLRVYKQYIMGFAQRPLHYSQHHNFHGVFYQHP
jgi:hypothetical protein